MPQIKQKVIKFIESPDEDQWLHQQCMKYADITLDQLGYVTCKTHQFSTTKYILIVFLSQGIVLLDPPLN